MLNREILEKLKNPQTLQETETSLGWISTGSLALNRIISGNYDQGIPVGAITQLRGDSSTGKTLFLTSILIEAQKKGYFTKLVDAENAYNETFARALGLDPSLLLYSAPECLEDAFADIENTIEAIRESDKETPIIIGLDSLAVLGTRKELNTENFEHSPADGAHRALVTGMCFCQARSVQEWLLEPCLRVGAAQLPGAGRSKAASTVRAIRLPVRSIHRARGSRYAAMTWTPAVTCCAYI